MTSSSLNLSDDSFSSNPEDYDIRLPIGYGSSAVVYNAYYKPFNRRVAIKVIDLDMFERNQIDELRRETQVMALCKHPNVLRVNGAFVTDSKLYIVTPYLSAGSCLDIMKTAYPDGFEEVAIATILKQALQGLDYLHKNGHIHRQVHLGIWRHESSGHSYVKAGNLLVDDDGSVLLADFGVSSSLMENGDRRGQRKTFVGTPCWMAPEVMEQAGYDYKADIWSFGITAIELATGHAPFAKYPPIKVLMLTLSNDPPTLDRDSTKHRYSKLLKEMIDSCLQKDPTRRPTAEKLLNHSFFKQAKKKAYLVSGLLHNLPPIEQRPHKRQVQKPIVIEKGISWNFDGDDVADSGEVRRPRTVTFERPDRPNSSTTTESAHSTGTAMTPTAETARTLDSLPDEAPSSQGTTPLSSHTGDKPVRKSRFVVEDSSSTASPALHPTTEAHPSPQAGLSHNISSLSIQSGQNLQGLGVTPHGAEAGGLPEVKKGRFSVKDTSATSSPVPSSIKTMPSDLLHSPSRSLTSSPVEGHPEGVRIVGASEHGPLPDDNDKDDEDEDEDVDCDDDEENEDDEDDENKDDEDDEYDGGDDMKTTSLRKNDNIADEKKKKKDNTHGEEKRQEDLTMMA
ncbi:hypothetical protein EC957_009409 [Mortierella hygrophila]|uniref:Protein kinase domain-containing protein n=1 Tax=Mortierella hygrophila TaxID=979708 RepID=A0A9P6FBA5_9FUNG|nr:hypothetical protein EC957_009409 [Mortierella hygrophila]